MKSRKNRRKIDVSDLILGPTGKGTRFKWGGNPEEGYADCATLVAHVLQRPAPRGIGIPEATSEVWFSCRSRPNDEEWIAKLREGYKSVGKGSWMALPPSAIPHELELGNVIISAEAEGSESLHFSLVVDEIDRMALTISETTRAALVGIDKIHNVKSAFRWVSA